MVASLCSIPRTPFKRSDYEFLKQKPGLVSPMWQSTLNQFKKHGQSNVFHTVTGGNKTQVHSLIQVNKENADSFLAIGLQQSDMVGLF